MKQPIIPSSVKQNQENTISTNKSLQDTTKEQSIYLVQNAWHRDFSKLFFKYFVFVYKIFFYMMVIAVSLHYFYQEKWIEFFINIVVAIAMFCIGLAGTQIILVRIFYFIKNKKYINIKR